MTRGRFTLRPLPAGYAVELDGHDIAAELLAVEIKATATGAQVTLSLGGLDAQFTDDEVRLLLDEDQQAVLRRLGWTPPADPAATEESGGQS